MGFLKRSTKLNPREGALSSSISSFSNASADELENHLQVARYGSFLLTDAVRPSYNLDVIPSAGFRAEKYKDRETGIDIPVLMVAQTGESIMDLFVDLIDVLGDEVDVVLETSHNNTHGGHDDLYREAIDTPILKSVLYDYEDLILNDGCTGLAVLNPSIPLEVQFDEHKLIILYGHECDRFREVLSEHGLQEREEMRFVTEAEHVHSSCEEYTEQFDELRFRLGIDE